MHTGWSAIMSAYRRYASPERRVEQLVDASPYQYQASPAHSTFNTHLARPSMGGGGGYMNPEPGFTTANALNSSRPQYNVSVDALGPQGPHHAYVRPSHPMIGNSGGLTSSRKPVEAPPTASYGSPLNSGGRMPLVDSQRGLADMSAMDDAPPVRGISDFPDFQDHSGSGMGSMSRASSYGLGEGALVPSMSTTMSRPLADQDREYGRSRVGTADAAWQQWVVVFGFPSDLREAVKAQFRSYGSIDRHVQTDGNWVLLQYATKQQAEKAIAQNGTFLRSSQPQDQVMIAVSRVTPEVVRKLGVAMTSNGDVQVKFRDEPLGSYRTDSLRQRTFRNPNATSISSQDYPTRREGRTYPTTLPASDRDIYRARTQHRNLCAQVIRFLSNIFNWG